MLGILSTIGGGLFKLVGGDIAKNIFGSVSDHFKNKREIKAAKAANELAIENKKMDVIVSKETHDIEWNLLWARQAADSWKDELWTVIFAGMFVSAFFWPGKLNAGLQVLASMDNDMKVMMAVVIGAAFGRAELTKFINRKK